MSENPSYSITTFNKEADSQLNKTSNEAATDVTHMDENPSYGVTTFNKTPDDSGTNMCTGNIIMIVLVVNTTTYTFTVTFCSC